MNQNVCHKIEISMELGSLKSHPNHLRAAQNESF